MTLDAYHWNEEDIETAIRKYLTEPTAHTDVDKQAAVDALFTLVGDNFFMGDQADEDSIQNRLDSGTESVVAITAYEGDKRYVSGSEIHKMVDTTTWVQIDCCSTVGRSRANEIKARIEDLVSLNIEVTVGSEDFTLRLKDGQIITKSAIKEGNGTYWRSAIKLPLFYYVTGAI